MLDTLYEVVAGSGGTRSGRKRIKRGATAKATSVETKKVFVVCTSEYSTCSTKNQDPVSGVTRSLNPTAAPVWWETTSLDEAWSIYEKAGGLGGRGITVPTRRSRCRIRGHLRRSAGLLRGKLRVD